MQYEALTWDHPRGYTALAAAAARLADESADVAIRWHRHALEGFESHSIEDLCEHYDLVVMDHPHVGEAVRAGCLQPLEDLFSQTFLKTLEADTIGPCFSSYRWEGRHWALPLDAATQVMACRPDLLDGPLPGSWHEVVQFGRNRGGLVLSLSGPHAVLSFFSLCASLCKSNDISDFFEDHISLEALSMLHELAKLAAPQSLEWNPIRILDAMIQGDDLALCPLIFGYVNYSDPRLPRPLAFANAPVSVQGGRRGSTLGGTGIAVSHRCQVTQGLVRHLEWLMSHGAQNSFIPDNDGQPSRRSAWLSAEVNRRWGDFYRNTAATIEHAYVRPRNDGYIRTQTEASAYLRQALHDGTPVAEMERGLKDFLLPLARAEERLESCRT